MHHRPGCRAAARATCCWTSPTSRGTRCSITSPTWPPTAPAWAWTSPRCGAQGTGGLVNRAWGPTVALSILRTSLICSRYAAAPGCPPTHKCPPCPCCSQAGPHPCGARPALPVRRRADGPAGRDAPHGLVCLRRGGLQVRRAGRYPGGGRCQTHVPHVQAWAAACAARLQACLACPLLSG